MRATFSTLSLGGNTMQISRRDMLKLTGLGALGAAGLTLPFSKEVSGKSISTLPSNKMPKPFVRDFRGQTRLKPYKVKEVDGIRTEYYNVTAQRGTADLVTGLPTPVLGYTGKDNGPGLAEPLTGQVPGPLISLEQNTRVVLAVHNQIPPTHPTFGTPVKISTHLHGSASLPQYDGYASDVSQSGFKKFYRYPNYQPARTLWYHDHGVHFTAQNAYSGLAAQYHVHDEAERELLPQGEFDVPVTISDIAFKSNGSQLYDDRSQSGLWGDVILVNGVPWPVMKVKPRIYRFRFLNASISRSYRPSTSPQVPTYMVATDGGLAPTPQPVTNWRHGNAERYEMLMDFRGFKPGATITLNNLSNDNNRDFDNTNKIMQFKVVDDSPSPDHTLTSIPGSLVRSDVMDLDPASSKRVRKLRFERSNGLWTVNGQTWDDVIRSGFTSVIANPGFGDVETWDIENNSGGWFHPVHIHLVDFKILSRNGSASQVKAYEKGPKDTVYVGENETVRVLMRFGDPKAPVKNVGKYMIHCHNLVHEDHDMMHQFSVGLPAGAVDGNDPIKADPPVKESDPRTE